MTKTLNPLELAALATAAVPGLNVVGLRDAQYGDESVSITGIVDDKGNNWVVVAPHDDEGGAGIESQLRVLAYLGRAYDKGLLPFDVPRPAGIVRPDQGGRAMVHPALRGQQMDWSDMERTGLLPTSLARSLAAFHELHTSVIANAGMPAYTPKESRARHEAMIERAATSGYLSPVLQRRWEAALTEESLWRFSSTPVHGDLGPGNVLVKDGAVTGMVGFAAAHVGDPAQDIAWILAQASDDFLNDFRSAYSVARTEDDLHVWTRAQLLSELAVVRWLVHGLNQQDESVIQDGREMLADLAESLGDAQLVENAHAGVEVEWSESMIDDSFPMAEGDPITARTDSAGAEGTMHENPDAHMDADTQMDAHAHLGADADADAEPDANDGDGDPTHRAGMEIVPDPVPQAEGGYVPVPPDVVSDDDPGAPDGSDGYGMADASDVPPPTEDLSDVMDQILEDIDLQREADGDRKRPNGS